MNGTTYDQLSFEFCIKPDTIRNIARRMDLPKRAQLRQPPADLNDKLTELGIEGARIHFKAGWTTITRWMKELALDKPVRKPVRKAEPRALVVPDDWATLAPTLYKFELCDHYRMGVKTVNRLIELTGIRSRKTPHEVARERPEPLPKRRTPRKPRNQGGRSYFTDHSSGNANTTLYQQAANHLRRHYRNVHRCDIQMREFERTTWGDEHKVPNHGKGFYFVSGRGIVADEDMVGLAERHGFCRAYL